MRRFSPSIATLGSGLVIALTAVTGCGPAPYAVDASDVDETETAAAPPAVAPVVAPAVVVASPAPLPRAVPPCSEVPVAPCYIIKNPPAPPPRPVAIMVPHRVPYIAHPPRTGVPSVVRAVVEQHHRQIRHCYERGLAHDPALAGRVLVEMRVDGDGEVDAARDAGSTLRDYDVVRCVVDVFEELDFDQNVGRRVVYPLDLGPGY